LAFKASELFPEGYYLEIICIEDGSRFFACHVSPKYLTYYANTGFETLDLVAYYQRHKFSEEINLKFHEKTIPELFYSFPGRRAEYLSRLAENKVFTINRYPYDPCIYELPKDWKAEFKTPWHIEHKIPSNIPNSPEGDYFFEYLQWKLRVGKPVSRKFSSFFVCKLTPRSSVPAWIASSSRCGSGICFHRRLLRFDPTCLNMGLIYQRSASTTSPQ
jgi:hypothetical protein